MVPSRKSLCGTFPAIKEYTNCMQIFLFTAGQTATKAAEQHRQQKHNQHHQKPPKNAARQKLPISQRPDRGR